MRDDCWLERNQRQLERERQNRRQVFPDRQTHLGLDKQSALQEENKKEKHKEGGGGKDPQRQISCQAFLLEFIIVR